MRAIRFLLHHLANVFDERILVQVRGTGPPNRRDFGTLGVLMRIETIRGTQLERQLTPVANRLHDDDARGPFDVRTLDR